MLQPRYELFVQLGAIGPAKIVISKKSYREGLLRRFAAVCLCKVFMGLRSGKYVPKPLIVLVLFVEMVIKEKVAERIPGEGSDES